MRWHPGLTTLTVLFAGAALQADIVRVPARNTAKPSSGSGLQLTRLMPSYTNSYLSSVGGEDAARNIAQQSAGAVHLTGNQVFYAAMAVVDGNPGGGLGPGGDGSADTTPLPPPPPARVPAPGALGLALWGLSFIITARRRKVR